MFSLPLEPILAEADPRIAPLTFEDTFSGRRDRQANPDSVRGST